MDRYTFFSGIMLLSPQHMQKSFSLIQTINTGTQITNETIRCFLKKKTVLSLIGSGDSVYRFYPESKKSGTIV